MAEAEEGAMAVTELTKQQARSWACVRLVPSALPEPLCPLSPTSRGGLGARKKDSPPA